MAGNGKIYLCYAPEDAPLVTPLMAALDAWGKTYSSPPMDTMASNQLSHQAQAAIMDADTFIRVCTANAQRSVAAGLQVNAYRGLQAADQQRGRSNRSLINLVLDAGYVQEPFDKATIFIDGTHQTQRDWMDALGRALGLSQTGRLSRRAVLGLGAATVATLAAAGAGVTFAADLQARKASNIQPAQLIWKKVFDGAKETPQPTIVGNTVYVVAENGMSALDLATGVERWRNDKIIGEIRSGLIAAGGTLYNTIDDHLQAYDAASGHVKWTLPSTDGYRFEGISNVMYGAIYLLTSRGTMVAARASDGHQLWHQATHDVSVEVGTSVIASSPVSDGHAIYFGADDHYIYSLAVADGSARWKSLLRGGVTADPVLVGSTVVVGSADGNIYGLNSADGKFRWRVPTGGAIVTACIGGGNVVYVGSTDQYLYALDGRSGSLYWAAPTGVIKDGIMDGGNPLDSSAPVVDGDVVSITGNDTLYVFNVRDGTKRWANKFAADDLSNATLGSGIVCVGTASANFTTNTFVATLYAYGA